MTKCLIFVFNAPNGQGNNPQTVEQRIECLTDDRATAYEQMVQVKAELTAQGVCGIKQLDAVDNDLVGEVNPDFPNTWNTLEIGEVVTDDFRVNLTGTFTNDSYENVCSSTPEQDLTTAVRDETGNLAQPVPVVMSPAPAVPVPMAVQLIPATRVEATTASRELPDTGVDPGSTALFGLALLAAGIVLTFSRKVRA